MKRITKTTVTALNFAAVSSIAGGTGVLPQKHRLRCYERYRHTTPTRIKTTTAVTGFPAAVHTTTSSEVNACAATVHLTRAFRTTTKFTIITTDIAFVSNCLSRSGICYRCRRPRCYRHFDEEGRRRCRHFCHHEPNGTTLSYSLKLPPPAFTPPPRAGSIKPWLVQLPPVQLS
jgi:hypothetical protein